MNTHISYRIQKIKDFLHIPDYRGKSLHVRINVILFHKFFRCKEIEHMGRDFNIDQLLAQAMNSKKEKNFIKNFVYYPDFRIPYNKELLIYTVKKLGNLEISYEVLKGSEYLRNTYERYRDLNFPKLSESELEQEDLDKNCYKSVLTIDGKEYCNDITPSMDDTSLFHMFMDIPDEIIPTTTEIYRRKENRKTFTTHSVNT
jgi:hypothetical protein